MYLSAREIPKTSLLTEWKGKKGRFVRTFAIDTTRNKNKWRVTWDSIVKNIETAIGYPGIEFMKCEDGECDLDHVEAETFKGLVEKQKPYKRATTIDYVLDEINLSADTIDEVHDDEFWEKLQSGEIKYVSPLIWPYSGGYEVIGYDEFTGQKIIDAWDWHWVHKAYLTKDPAFGTEKANIKAMCEGDNCQMQMLSAKQLIDISLHHNTSPPQKEFPMIVKHQGHLHYLSASEKVQEIITKKKEDGIKIDDKIIAAAYSEAGESNKAKSSFKTCTCNSKQLTMSAEETKIKELEAKLKATEDEKDDFKAKLKANDDEKNDNNLKAKLKAKFSAMFKGMSEDERENMKAKLKGVEDEENMKAMEEVHKEMKAKEDGEGNDTTISKLKASIEKLQSHNLPMYIDGLVALKASTGVDQKLVREYHTALLAKTFDQVESLYSNDEIIIKGLPAKSVQSAEARFEMADNVTALKGKSSEEIIAEAQK